MAPLRVNMISAAAQTYRVRREEEGTRGGSSVRRGMDGGFGSSAVVVVVVSPGDGERGRGAMVLKWC